MHYLEQSASRRPPGNPRPVPNSSSESRRCENPLLQPRCTRRPSRTCSRTSHRPTQEAGPKVPSRPEDAERLLANRLVLLESPSEAHGRHWFREPPGKAPRGSTRHRSFSTMHGSGAASFVCRWWLASRIAFRMG